MKVLLIGSFSLDCKDNGGQPVKSRELYYGIKNMLGSDNVHILETPNWKKHPIRLLFDYFCQANKHDVIIMLPSHRGVYVFSKLLSLSKKLCKKKIFYDVIGGWLQDDVSKNSRLKNRLSHFNGIWVETTTMKNDLMMYGLHNVCVVPNFKRLSKIAYHDLVNIPKKIEPLKLCTFSRVIKEKGIEDAINAVNSINKECRRTVFLLDIYGEVYAPYQEEFDELMAQFPSYIAYKGMVRADKSVETLVNYSALLFPTHYYTEGIPGTIIDAYSAGLPIITCFWKNYQDVFEDGVTGFGYQFDDEHGLKKALYRFLQNINSIDVLTKNCLNYSIKFDAETNMKLIMSLIDN